MQPLAKAVYFTFWQIKITIALCGPTGTSQEIYLLLNFSGFVHTIRNLNLKDVPGDFLYGPFCITLYLWFKAPNHCHEYCSGHKVSFVSKPSPSMFELLMCFHV